VIHGTARPKRRKYPGAGFSDGEAAMSDAIRDLTIDELDTASGGDFGDLNQMDSMRLQTLMDRRSKMYETLSNLMKKVSDTGSGIVANLK
jgi:hypothetical protein